METVRDRKEITRRLEAEMKACEIDPLLLKNNFVRGIIRTLEIVEAEFKTSYGNPEIDIDDFVNGMKDAIQFVLGENKF